MFKIGEPPYLSTLSLTIPLRTGAAAAGVELVQGRLTELSSALLNGELAAGPIAVSEYLRHRDRFELLPNVAISSCGRATCGLLISKRSLGNLNGRSVAVPFRHGGIDELLASMLWEIYGVRPVFSEAVGSYDQLLVDHDAALLFEDDALLASQMPNAGMEIWDLGDAWWQLTQTPLLYMLWVTQRSLAPSVRSGIAGAFIRAKEMAGSMHRAIIQEAQKRVELPEKVLEGYLGRFNYEFTPAHERGLALLDKNFLRIEAPASEPCEVPRI